MSSPSCLTKVNFLRKVSGHRLYETGLSNDQTEILKNHPASLSPIQRLPRRENQWQEWHLFKLVIQFLWWHWPAQCQLCNLALRDREDTDPLLKMLLAAKMKRIKDKLIICLHFRRKFLGHWTYITVVRCFQPVVPSISYDMINFMEKYWLHPRINFQMLKFISALCCSCQRLKWQAICEKRRSNQRSKKVHQEPQGELKLESVIVLFTRSRSYSHLKWGFKFVPEQSTQW